MNYLWKFHHFFGSLNSRSFSTGFQLLTMLGGMSKFQTTNLQSSKRALFCYLFTSVWACILFWWIDPCLLHSVRWHCLKIKSWETTWQSEKKNSYGGRYWHFLCKIWSNPQKNEPNRCPSSYHRRVLLSRNTTKTLSKIWWLFDTGFHIIWWEDFKIMTLFTP